MGKLLLDKNSDNNHLAFLDGIRALAAIYVMLGHSMRDLDIYSSKMSAFLFSLTQFGHHAVVVFIVLSGYCLMLPVVRNDGRMKDSTLTFFIKRAKRILPTYYLAMILALIMILTVINDETPTKWHGVGNVSLWDIFTHITLIHDLFVESSRKINYVFWSIAVEWKIYFFFPLIVWIWRKIGAWETTISFVLFSVLISFLLYKSGLNLNFSHTGMNPYFLGLFVIGMLACHISFSSNAWCKGFRESNMIVLVMTALFFFVIALQLLAKPFFMTLEAQIYPSGRVFIDIITSLFTFTFLIVLSTKSIPRLNSILSLPLLVFVGSFSYSLYLIHPLIIELIVRHIILPLNISATFGILLNTIFGIPFIIFFSYLFFLVAEKPFLSRKKLSVVIKEEKVLSKSIV